MDARIILGVVVIAIVAIFFVIGTNPNTGFLKSILPSGANGPSSLTSNSTQLKPLSILYNGTSILNSTERDTVLKSNFYVTNTNTATVILESINYEISANGMVIGHGQIGNRYEGSWESSYYYPLITGVPSNIGNTDDIKNTGNFPEVWSALQNGTAKFSISGTVYYATKTAFSGNDYSQIFNFTG
ncbi:MAG: hypothetical protein KGI25_04870 [Thaumarchaeota archaeon]|nr:hypothetical protein [Nitrososphaerota archaeon]